MFSTIVDFSSDLLGATGAHKCDPDKKQLAAEILELGETMNWISLYDIGIAVWMLPTEDELEPNKAAAVAYIAQRKQKREAEAKEEAEARQLAALRAHHVNS